MKKINRLSFRKIKKAFAILLVFGVAFTSSAQTIDEFCNCDTGFPTQTPPNSYQNGVILASQFFKSLPPAARRVVSNRCYVIDRPFVFDEPILRRFSNCNFTMIESASIIIPEGSPGFHFRGGSIRSCTGENWTGIQVEKHAFIDLEGAIIGGARSAIQVQDSAKLNIRGCTFEDNIIGIDIAPDATPLGAPVFGNTFRNGRVGVNNMGILYIGSPSSANHFGPNLDAGVLGTNGITNIRNSIFEECHVGAITNNSESIVMLGNQFKNCSYGIQDVNSNITVEENVFEDIQFTAIQLIGHVARSININFNIIDAWYGVEGTQIFSDDFRITYNNILPKGNFYSGINLSGVYTDAAFAAGNTIRSTDDVLDGAAILLSGCNGFRVGNNQIDLLAGKAAGLSLVNSNDCLISENRVNGTEKQIGVSIENSQINLYCNELSNHANGILIKGYSLCDIATNFLIDAAVGLFYEETAISGPQEHTGNIWIGDFSSIGAFHDNDNPNFYKLSGYTVAGDTFPLHPSHLTPENWFVTDYTGITRECGSASRPGNTPKTGSKIDPAQLMYKQIAENALYPEVKNAGLQFKAERSLSEKINSNLVNGDELYNDFQNNNLSAAENFNALQNSIEQLSDFDSQEYSDYLLNQKEIDFLNEEIAGIDEKIETTGSEAKKSDLLALRGEFLKELKKLVRINQSLRTLLETNFSSKVKSIKADLSKISSNNQVEANEKFVQSAFLNILTGGTNSITDEEISSLKSLAVSDPHVEGMAVYKAKVLLMQIENPALNFEFETPSLNTLSGKSYTSDAVTSFEADIFPNPATDALVLKLPFDNIDAEILTEVFDMTGNRIMTKSFTENPIDISELSNGFYFLKISVDDQLIGTKKFSVAK